MSARSVEPIPSIPRTAASRGFAHASYAAAAQAIQKATGLGPGFMVLTGAAGTGKTTLVQDVAEQLGRHGHCVGWVAKPRGEAEDLLRLTSRAFGLTAESWVELSDQLFSLCPLGQTAVLIIDEAQDLAPGALPGLWQLEIPPLQILLSGRDGLWALLDRPDHARIRQWILASCRLDPLSPEETPAYLAYALETAGRGRDPGISADGVRLLHARTGGVPQLISLTLADLLAHGRQPGTQALGPQDVDSAIGRLSPDHPELLAEGSPPSPGAEHASQPPLSALDVQGSPARVHPPPRPTRRLSAVPRGRADTETLPSLERLGKRTQGRGLRWALAGLTGAGLLAVIVAVGLVGMDQEEAPTAAVSGEESGEAPLTIIATEEERPDAGQARTRDEPAPVASVPGRHASESEAVRPEGPPDPAVQAAQTPAAPTAGLAADGPPVTAAENLPMSAQAPEGPGDSELMGDAAASGVTISEGGSRRSGVPDEPPEAASPAGVENGAEEQTVSRRPETQAEEQPATPAEVAALIQKADLAFSKDHLLIPSSDSAYGYYREVLALDPGNEQAQSGVQRIVERYRELAQISLSKGDPSAARRYASRGLKVAPQDRELLAIQRRASESEPERPSPGPLRPNPNPRPGNARRPRPRPSRSRPGRRTRRSSIGSARGFARATPTSRPFSTSRRRVPSHARVRLGHPVWDRPTGVAASGPGRR